MSVHVGIDIGTTSAKICAKRGDEILFESKQPYHFPNCLQNGLQDPQVILSTTLSLLSTTESLLSSKNLKISEIWTCGQMHGIVLWNQQSTVTSPLYNWTYSNPNLSKFLEVTLPKWSLGQVHPGFGLGTLAFLNHTEQENLKNFNRCGTIMDLFLSNLTASPDITISHHNAHSWGYCTSDATWQKDILEFLPRWIQLPTVTRDTSQIVGTWHGAKCHVASGDLQASVASLESYEDTAYLILGTSAQLCCLIPSDSLPTTVPPTVVQLPYSTDKKLIAACAMNGGNALEAVLKNFSKPSNSENLANLLGELNKKPQILPSDLKIDPIFIPERGISKELEISGLSPTTTDLQILEATHLGIIRNLFSLFPISLLKSLGIQNLALVGSAQCHRFRRHIEATSEGFFKFLTPKLEISTPLGATRF